MTWRSNYWSCSKFAGWVGQSFFDTPKPKIATSEGWRDWNKQERTNHPVIYWFVEEFLDGAQQVVCWPIDKLHAVRVYIKNRFVTKMHMAPTGLAAGQWYDTDTRLLHSMFELLVDFIEIEKANMNLFCEKQAKRPWWHTVRLTRWGVFRSREMGLEYLNWEVTLGQSTVDEWGNDTSSPAQAGAAREQLELYIWWKDIRPVRPDPHDVSGWTDFCDNNIKDEDFLFPTMSEEDQEKTRVLLKVISTVEQKYEYEDTLMMERLIRVRRYLWT